MATEEMEMTTLFSVQLATTREEFDSQQNRSVTWRCSGFSLSNWILGLMGVFSICVSLFEISLIREILISIAVGGAVGILFNALVICMHLLLCSNERKLKNNTRPRTPSPELIRKCFQTQEFLLTHLILIEMSSVLIAAYVWVYFVTLVVANSVLSANSPPQDDPNHDAVITAHHLFQAIAGSWFLFWFFTKPLSSRAISRFSRIIL